MELLVLLVRQVLPAPMARMVLTELTASTVLTELMVLMELLVRKGRLV
jgi:hypothetical protein